MSEQIRDLYCPACERTWERVWCEYRNYGHCDCGEARVCGVFPVATWEWSTPKYFASLDKTFASRSDLEAYKQKHDIRQAPQAEKHHGARNEEYLNIGRVYSNPSVESRGSYSKEYGERKQ